ncbi:Cyanobacteria-specific RpoD-like sigma factor type-1 [Geitlerinema sp. FC II]|nr:RNA polymerase sigma factor, RpoD/SigA family [Geitlerinema sp. CS-897]PPT10842.1 Cyanobacteria-specific RpoD-like sigma factor type-1 [Geitlerinema sp. FC II]
MPTSEGDSTASIAAARPTGYSKNVSDDAVGAFFKEMARYPLLSRDEEIALARQVRELVGVRERRRELSERLGRKPSLAELADAMETTPEQLEKRIQRGRIAQRKMVRSNLRLVVSIAKRYLNRGVPFLDLIQEGALGLSRATEKFDPEKGYKFSTYAYWWIRQGITRTIANDGRTIRLPIHIVEKLNKLKKTYRKLGQELNRQPTEAELSEALELSPKQLQQLQRVSQRSLSLNHYVGDEDNTEILDLLEDTDNKSPDSQVTENMMCQGVRQVLDEALTARESEILALRYGLNGGQRQTLQEISNLFDLSRERVRQIQTTAMRKLRRPQVAKRLRGWLK